MTGHVSELLSEFIDNALPEAERLAVERHVSGCAACAAELEDLRSNVAVLKALPRKPLPPGFMARLEAKRSEPKKDYVFLPFPARVAAFAASSFIVAFVVFEKFRASEPPAMISGAVSDLAAPASIGALRGGSAGGGMSGRKLEIRAPGKPLFEAEDKADALAFSNEQQHRRLEAEKKVLGIQRIITPAESRAQRRAELATVRGFTSAMAAAESEPVAVGAGSTVDLAAAGRRRVSVQAALSPFEGGAARDADELRALWKEAEPAGAAPQVDFSKHMVVVAPGAVVDARESAGLIVVRWRPGPRGHAVIAKSRLPVAFELKKQ